MSVEYIKKTTTYLATEQAADGLVLDDMEGAISSQQWSGSGSVGMLAARDTVIRLRGLQSTKLVTATTGFAFDQVLYQKQGGPSVAKQVKAIYNFNPVNMDDRLWFIDFDGGALSLQTKKYVAWNARVERTGANAFKLYVNTSTGQVLIATLTGTSITNGYFSRLELLVDMATGKVLTVALNGVSYDTSAYTPQTFITATYASKLSFMTVTAYQGADNLPFTVYIDDNMIQDQ